MKKTPPTYLVAKYIPDPLRMEPRNVGVVLLAGGSVSPRFSRPEEIDFIDDLERYSDWVNYWQELCERLSVRPVEDVIAELTNEKQAAFRFYKAGYIDAPVKAKEVHEALDYLFETLVSSEPVTGASQVDGSTFAQKCEAVLKDAGLINDPSFLSDRMITLSAAGIEQDFKFDYVLDSGEVEALMQRVRLQNQPSTTNAAFLFEHATGTKQVSRAERIALVDASVSVEASVARLQMLKRMCRTVDVSDHDAAVTALRRAG